ncbi:hypothetical protein [Paraburkholderia phytofirmans]|uniref:Uncharacterized protein n=1 Tax=Paraburkholderia phytofirmans (strain DSM 17436 / LMG 22146 / PsJN) TaxID=398527 RepID=B2T1Z9_PARPJ|nr:hypothetical protein [Paraburkholderia phytofirmans]ACD15610.1 hypothetical protein Bphyt_1195 [Paraburkholderia phytofirmans PsJN]
MKALRLTALAALTTLLLVDSAFAKTGQILVGNGGNRPAWSGMEYPCGTVVQDVAAGFCTKYTTNGKQVGEYYLTPKSNVAGGQCGWTVYEIECVN